MLWVRAVPLDNMHDQLSRRGVIKTLLVTTATSLIGNKAWAGKVISEVKANLDDPTAGIARIPVASYPALANNGGSVRLGSSKIIHSASDSIFPEGIWYPIIINRISATEYVTLESQCAHAGCVVNAYSSVTGRISCPCHGSQYDIRGVVKLGPAGFNLLSYPTTLKNGILIIKCHDQGFDTHQTQVLNGSEKRLQFTWDSFNPVEYELRWRPNFATEPSVVPFAATQTGPVNQTLILGNDDVQSLYVVPLDGFYQIATRLRPV
jgi:Rieske Fe-S protein